MEFGESDIILDIIIILFFVRNDSTLNHPQIYGQPEPLPWLLEEVNVPVSLYWGQNDWLSAIEDYTRMQDEVRFTKIGIYRVRRPSG